MGKKRPYFNRKSSGDGITSVVRAIVLRAGIGALTRGEKHRRKKVSANGLVAVTFLLINLTLTKWAT